MFSSISKAKNLPPVNFSPQLFSQCHPDFYLLNRICPVHFYFLRVYFPDQTQWMWTSCCIFYLSSIHLVSSILVSSIHLTGASMCTCQTQWMSMGGQKLRSVSMEEETSARNGIQCFSYLQRIFFYFSIQS